MSASQAAREEQPSKYMEHVHTDRKLMLKDSEGWILVTNTGSFRVSEDETLPLIPIDTWPKDSRIFYQPTTAKVVAVSPLEIRYFRKNIPLSYGY